MWRRRWLALGFAWTVCVVGWFAVALMPDRYVSEARFHVDTTSLLNPLLRGISVNTDDHGRDQEVAIMQRTLTSRPNLTKVAQMTDLDKTVHSPAEMQGLVTSLEDRIVVQNQGTNLFAVQFSDNSPVVAKNVVQALLTIFVESSTGNKREDIQTARAFIDTQIGDYEVQLKAAEQRLADFKVKNVGFFSSSSQTFAMRLEGSAREYRNSEDGLQRPLSAQRDQLKHQLAATPQFLAVDAISPYAAACRRARQLAAAAAHPCVATAARRIETAIHRQTPGSGPRPSRRSNSLARSSSAARRAKARRQTAADLATARPKCPTRSIPSCHCASRKQKPASPAPSARSRKPSPSIEDLQTARRAKRRASRRNSPTSTATTRC